jgi:hypothetical protein
MSARPARASARSCVTLRLQPEIALKYIYFLQPTAYIAAGINT